MRLEIPRSLLVISVTSLVLRLGYVLAAKQVPVVWDASIYDRGGEAIAQWMGPRLPDLIRGIVQWRHEVLADFAGDLGLVTSKGPTYPVLLGVIYLLFGHSYAAARVTQAILDSLTTLLVGIIGVKAFSRSVGRIAAVLYCVYQPAILMTGQIMQETLMVFLLAVALWLLMDMALGASPAHWPRLVLAGILLGAIMLGRPALQYLFVFFLPAFWLAGRAALSERWKRMLVLVAVMLAIVLPAAAYHCAIRGRLMINSTQILKAHRDFFHGIHPATEGWEPDLSDSEGRGGPPASLNDFDIPQGSSYLDAAKVFLLHHPIAPIWMAIYKAYLLYALPCAEWHEKYLFPRALVVFLHKALIIGGLLGLACSFSSWRKIALPAALVLYILGVCSVWQLHLRYALPALPAWVLFAGIGFSRLRESLKARPTLRNWAAWSIPILVSLVLLGTPLLHASSLSAATGWMKASTALIVSYVLRSAVVIWFVTLMYRRLRSGTSDRTLATGMALTTILAVVVVVVHEADHGNWREWHVTLTSPNDHVVQVINLPPDLPAIARASLFIDIGPDLLPTQVVALKIGNGGPVRIEGKDLGGVCFQQYMQEANRRWQGAYEVKDRYDASYTLRLRKWLEVPVALDLLTKPELRIELSVPAGGRLDVYGDLEAPGGQTRFAGPSMNVCGATLKTSVKKSENDWDYRVHETTPLFPGVYSRVSRSDGGDDGQLIGEARRPPGRYRIFLVLFRVDGTRLVV